MREKSLAYQSFLKSEYNSLNYIGNPEAIEKQIQMTLKGTTLMIGAYHIIEDKRYNESKQRFNYGGLCYNQFNEVYTSKEEYWMPTHHLCWILMSDNKELYQLLKKNCHYPLSEEHLWMTWVNAMLQIATSDWKSLEQTFDFFLKEMKPIETIFLNTKVYTNIFEGFLEQNKTKIESALNIMESDEHKKPRIKSDEIEKYLSPQTIVVAKMAWMHGMEVEIDSPYVPKELLPFEPLEEYTIPYKFLRDYYRPLGYTWRYDPVYPELQDWDNDPENPDRDKGGFLKRLFS